MKKNTSNHKNTETKNKKIKYLKESVEIYQ